MIAIKEKGKVSDDAIKLIARTSEVQLETPFLY